MPKRKSQLRSFAAVSKNETRVLGDIQRMLLDPTREDKERDESVLHVSELTKKEWCERRAYYRLTGAVADELIVPPHFQLETIFEAGNEIHRKWQGWVHALGRLRGLWRCMHCLQQWEATSPKTCPSCGSEALAYMEVPIWSEKYMVSGHADGDVDEGSDDISTEPLIEIKSIGLGTLRMEVPHLLAKYSHKVEIDGEEKTWTDLDKLWREIRRPFPSHLKQGMTYGYLAGRTHVVFIYEYKPTQAVKEFTVKVQHHMIEDVLERALDTKYAVATKKLPVIPMNMEQDKEPCKTCPYRRTCWETSNNKEHDESQAEPERRDTNGGTRSPGRTRTRRVAASGQAEVRDPIRSDEAVRARRRHPDEPVREADEVGRLPEWATGPGVGGGAERRGAARYRRGNRPPQ